MRGKVLNDKGLRLVDLPRKVVTYNLTCVECGFVCTNRYAIDRMIVMARHWKRAGHDGVPVFDAQTWRDKRVPELAYRS